MKNIKELGLETIQLEDQVLLVRSGQIPDNWYLDDANQIRQSITHDPDWWCARKGYRSIIASTKPLEGLPILVIEDEVEYMADNCVKNHPANRTLNEDGWMSTGYVYGYNKAKETYKFTEDDLRNALSESFKASQEGYQITSDEIIQSLTKKELWIEIEGCSDCHLNEGYMSSPNCCKEVQPKIKDGKIKAIWK